MNLKSLCLWAILAGVICGGRRAQAGSGTIDVTAKTMDLSVLFTYSESDDNLDGAASTTWKEVFNEGSRRLWNATNGQLRLGKVTVYTRALDRKDDADVWISPVGNTAYSTDAGVLGVPGQHMQFFANKHLSLSGYLGDCSIAHEIGHYAFGLWDEYIGFSVPLAKKDNYTDADARYESDNPNIHSISDTDTIASLMDAGGGVPGKKLRTEFDTAANIVKGTAFDSRWFMNKQWYKRKESCWETMSKLTFDGTTVFQNIPTGASPNAAPPNFVDIEWEKVPTLSRLVLCIDRSASMAVSSKMQLAIAGAKIFTNLTQEAHTFEITNASGVSEGTVTVNGDELGVVDFNDAASTDLPLTTVDENGDTKGDAESDIGTLYATGHTAIGDGLQQALGVITAAGSKVTQEAVILLSDGFDDSSTITPAEAAGNCAVRGVRVFSIALGSDADAGTLGAVAIVSHGKLYQATDALGLLQIYPTIAAELKGGGLVSSVGDISHEQEDTSQTVTVDPFTEETSFSLSSVSAGFTFSIKSPNGKIYTGSVPADGVRYEKTDNEAHFRVSNPAPGKWEQFVTAPSGSANASFRYALTNTSATAKVNVSVTTPKAIYDAPDPIVFQCSVTATDPVGGADVKGVVTGPDGNLFYVTLYDDGLAAHADETANDGVYSATFAPPSGNGVYTIDVTAINKTGKQAIVNPEKGDTPFVPQAIAPFQRTTSATVRVTGATAVHRDWFRVDALSIRKNKNDITTGTIKMTAELNAQVGQLRPLTSLINVFFGENSHYGNSLQIPADALEETKIPGVYKISNEDGLSGTLMLEIGGSSRTKLIVTKKNFDLTGTPFASSLDVKILCGNYLQKVTLEPTLTPAQLPTKLTYLSKRNFAETPTLFLDGIKASINHATLNKDTLRIVSTFQGDGQNYDPATQAMDVRLGNFTLTIPQGTLTLNARKVAKGKVPIGAGSAQVTIDLQKHTFVLTGSKLELNGLLDRTNITALELGDFAQKGVLTTKQTFTGTTEKLRY
ncbi:MAG: calcium-activated chloride channel regulator 3/4 [Chthoniobacter sp.]|nr:calcium-activated chloride channel regulator 3/4 [Chthoniobacter sp.]